MEQSYGHGMSWNGSHWTPLDLQLLERPLDHQAVRLKYGN